MTTCDGLACLSLALVVVGFAWDAAWASMRNAAIRAEALRRLGEPTWRAKTMTTRRAKS